MAKKIMVVDDSTFFRHLVVDILGFGPYEVSQFPNGEEAMEAARETVFDIVVTDLNMGSGRMNGILFAHSLAEIRTPPPRIILMSAEDLSGMEAEVGDVISAFVRKPFRIKEFLKIVDPDI